MTDTKPRRATIRAVADRAGVSPSAVSHVFNGRAHVSAATEARIRKAADELHWRPNLASRKVSGQGGRSLGLIVARSADTFGRDPFFMRLISGLTEPLAAIEWSLSLTLVTDAAEEESTYRRWWAEQRADAFLLADVRADDPRLALVRDLGAPAVLLGPPISTEIPAVTVPDDPAFAVVLEHLRGLGHSSIARVSAGPGLAHTAVRDEHFTAAAAARGMESSIATWRPTETDPVALLLADLAGATAIIVDNETIAAELVARAPELGVGVPHDLSIVAWEDSWVSHITRPRLTALNAPVEESARSAVDAARLLVDGSPAVSITVSDRSLVVRESTAPPPTTSTSTTASSTTPSHPARRPQQ